MTPCLPSGVMPARTLVDAEVAGRRARRGLAVAGQHHDAETGGPQRPKSRRRMRLDRIRDCDEARRLAVDCDPRHRPAPRPQRLGAGDVVVGEPDPRLTHQRLVPDKDFSVADQSADAASR